MTALVTENVPLVAGAPGGINKLRALVIDLAIRGLLTRPKEAGRADPVETARPNGARWPFSIPAHWRWCRLSELQPSYQNGASSRGEASGVPVTVIRLADIKGGEVSLTDPRTLTLARSTVAKYELSAGDILVIRVNGSADLVGRFIVCRDGLQAIPCDHFIRARFPADLVDSAYLKIVGDSGSTRSAISDLFVSTAGQKTVNQGHIGSLCVPLPPLAEQRRVVAKVDELMALCDRLEAEQADAEAAHAKLVEALLASLTQARDAADFRASWQQLAEHFHTLFTTEASVDALKQSIVHLAVMGKLAAPAESETSASDFLAEIEAARVAYESTPGLRTRQRTDQAEAMAPAPYPAPDGWEWRNLGSILLITGGVTLGRKMAGREVVSRPYLRVANVQRGFLVLDQVKEIEVPADEVEKYTLAPGDLLTTEGGDWDKVGRTAVWQGEIAQCLHQNHVFRSRPYTDKFSSRWVELYLNSPSARDYFAGSAKQTTNLASINMTQLRACAFPVPPLAEQRRIVAAVDALFELCDQLKHRLVEVSKHHEQVASILVTQAAA